MPVPLSLGLPVAAAGLAYINVKTALWYDLELFRGGVSAIVLDFWRNKVDRMNVFYRLEARAKSSSTANQPFILFQDKSWTYAQTYEMALRYGNYFKTQHQVRKGDVVATDMMNSDLFIFVCMGLWSIGAKPALINYNLTGKALSHCVKAANAALLLLDPEIAHNVDETTRQELPGLCVVTLTPDLLAEVSKTTSERPPDSLRSGQQGHDMGALIYTSGTTGLPKAAVVSWSKLTLAGSFLPRWLGIQSRDVLYTCMPLYHSTAFVMGFAQVLECGATFAIGRKFSARGFWSEARAYNATVVQYVGETCRYLLAAPPVIDAETGENVDKKHRVRMAFGNGLRPDVWEKFRERFGIEYIAEFYGATEGPLATWNKSRNEFSAGAIGRNGWLYGLVITQRMRIVRLDEEDVPERDADTGLCRQVNRGEIGELMFRLGSDWKKNFQGYYNNAEATHKKVVRDVCGKGDIYFRTGDLISWDKDGRMFFHDRIGDTFRWKSENVATTEVSHMLGMHPTVQEANVYGVQLPNHDGRAGCVAIMLNDSPGPELLASLAEHAKKTLPKYAVPIFLRVVRDLEGTTTGTNKQQKHHLRTQGVDLDKIGDDEMYWLRGNTYVPFLRRDWETLNGGGVKL